MFKRLSALSAAERKPSSLSSYGRLALLFSIEGVLLQYAVSLNGFGNNIFATYIGATPTQIGLLPTVSCAIAVLLLLPVGIAANRTRSPKTIPVILLLAMSVTYFFAGMVPSTNHRIVFFYIFVGLSVGLLSTYNGIWQSFFGDVTTQEQRSKVYTVRNRFVFLIGMAAPLIFGGLLSARSGAEQKLEALRVFYFISSAFMLLQAVIVFRIKGGERDAADIGGFSLSVLREAVSSAAKSKKFVSFFIGVLLFYMSWQLDWSMWYVSEVQYLKLNESQLSYVNAFGCVAQLIFLSFSSRMIFRKGAEYAFLFCVGSLSLSPFLMIFCTSGDVTLMKQWVFLICITIVSSPIGSVGLCVIQMLLDSAPTRNRPIIISLYNIAITLSNALIPLAGVQYYLLLGANHRAMVLFFLSMFLFRSSVFVLSLRRWSRSKKEAAAEALSQA